MATTRTITNAFVNKVLPDIFYEDPEPVEDGMQQAPIILEVAYLLTAHFRRQGDVFVSAGGFIFYDRANGNRRIAPDCYIAFDVDPKAVLENLPNYWIWEIGKPPDFVMEVASPSTASNDLGHKRDLYAQLGIAEYWRLDPTDGELYGQPLTGERLVDGEYQPLELHEDEDGTVWAHSEVLDLVFHWNPELTERFDILDPATGKTINEAEVEREARLTEWEALSAERERRLAAEAREQALLAEIERLRGQAAPDG